LLAFLPDYANFQGANLLVDVDLFLQDLILLSDGFDRYSSVIGSLIFL
jgi:hypothetical protein